MNCIGIRYSGSKNAQLLIPSGMNFLPKFLQLCGDVSHKGVGMMWDWAPNRIFRCSQPKFMEGEKLACPFSGGHGGFHSNRD